MKSPLPAQQALLETLRAYVPTPPAAEPPAAEPPAAEPAETDAAKQKRIAEQVAAARAELAAKGATTLRKWAQAVFLAWVVLTLLPLGWASRSGITPTARSHYFALAAAMAVAGLVLLAIKFLALAGGLSAIFIGKDGRASTSKTTAAVWTLVLAVALIYLIFVNGLDAAFELDPLYLLLLGGPYAAWVISGAVVRSKVDNQTLQKTQATHAQLLSDLVTNDDGDTSLTDLQYLTFSGVTLVYFVWNFLALVPKDAGGLPALPAGLVMLTSAGALTYLGQKSLQTNAPYITSITPTPGTAVITARAEIMIRGGNFTPPGTRTDFTTLIGTRVKFITAAAEVFAPVVPSPLPSGVPYAQALRAVSNPSDDELRVTVPNGLQGNVDVQVCTITGALTEKYPLLIAAAPAEKVDSQEGGTAQME